MASLLLGSLGNNVFSVTIINNFKGGGDGNISWSVIIMIFFVAIICALFLFLSKIALFKSIADIRSDQFVGIRDSYKKAKTLFWSTIFISLSVQFALSGSLLLLIVPGIILYGYLVFSQYELYVNEKRGIQALLASWRLIKGYWWTVFLKMVTTALIIFLFFIITTAVLTILAIFAGLLFKGSVVSIIFYIVVVILFILTFFLFLSPLSILAIFEIYYDLREVREGTNEVDVAQDDRRKKKILASIVLGIISLSVSFFIGFYTGFKEAAANRFDELKRIVIPHEGHFTAESAFDLFTIDYPTSWHKRGENMISNPQSYIHGIYFIPNDKKQASSTEVSLIVSSLPKGISDIDSFKRFFISLIENYPNRKVTSINVSTTTISIYPALQFSYDMEDTTTPSLTTDVHLKIFQKVFLRGDFYYMISYEATPEYFSKNIETVNGIIDSLYLYYTHEKVGELSRYTSRDYGFEIDYPSNWIDIGSLPDNGRAVQFTRQLYDAEGRMFERDNVRVSANYFDEDPKSFIDAVIRFEKKITKSFIVDRNEPVKLSKYEAIRLSYSFRGLNDTATSSATAFFVPYNGKIYTISFTGPDIDESLIQNMVNSFTIIGPYKSVDTENLVVYENRQFGNTITVPKEWSRVEETDLLSGIAESYMPLRDPSDVFVGVMSLGTIDADLYPRSYPIADYRNDQVMFWKRWYGESKDFKTKETGSIVVDGNPAAYFIGSYKGESGPDDKLPHNLKVKQVFIDKDNMKRWLSYIDDEVDFEKNVIIFDQAVESFTWR